MTSPVSPEQISWTNLPSEAALEKMTSPELLAVIRNLEMTKPAPPPSEAVDWLMANANIADPAVAADTLVRLAYPLRNVYIQKVRAWSDLAFENEPTGPQNDKLFQELDLRQLRLHASLMLGLRTQDEENWISEKRQAWSRSHGSVVMSARDAQDYQHSAHRAQRFSEKLATWKGMLDEIEGGLPALDTATVRARLDEELQKPFAPSPQEIENTQLQLGAYDSHISPAQAVEFLKRENQQHLDVLSEWRTDLDGGSAPAVKRPGP